MKALTPVVIFLLALATNGPAAERRIYETISSPEMKLLLTDAGYTGIEINGNDDLTITMNDYHVLVVVRGNKYQNIQFRFAIRAKATLEFVNNWNKEKSYTKAYLDNDGDPVIEMDLELTGGVTEERIKDGVATFSSAMAAFLKDLG